MINGFPSTEPPASKADQPESNFGTELVLPMEEDYYPHMWMRMVDVEGKFMGLSFTHKIDSTQMRRIAVAIKGGEKLAALRDFFAAAASSIDAFIERAEAFKVQERPPNLR